jgi:hypothetical protein
VWAGETVDHLPSQLRLDVESLGEAGIYEDRHRPCLWRSIRRRSARFGWLLSPQILQLAGSTMSINTTMWAGAPHAGQPNIAS